MTDRAGSLQGRPRFDDESTRGGTIVSLDYEIYDLGDVKLQRGATLRGCKLAYKTFGALNAA